MEIEAMIIMLVVYLVAFVFAIALYVIRSLSLHTVAKRRGINKPWLSWIPVGQEWIIGSISDRYQDQVCGKQTSRRKFLLGFGLASAVLMTLGFVLLFGSMISMIVLTAMEAYPPIMDEAFIIAVMIGYVIVLFAAPLAITTFVFRCMALYDVYRSCEPDSAVMFLVLGIIFQVTEPFFLLVCRKKDKGMPIPEANAVPAEIPAAIVGPEL